MILHDVLLTTTTLSLHYPLDIIYRRVTCSKPSILKDWRLNKFINDRPIVLTRPQPLMREFPALCVYVFSTGIFSDVRVELLLSLNDAS